MATTQADLQQILKRQLATLKRDAMATAADSTIPDQPLPTPKWFTELTTTVQHQQAQTLTQQFTKLINQLPLVAKTNHAGATTVYLQQIITELAKIYYVRLRLVKLDDRLSTNEQNQKIQSLLTECQTEFRNIVNLLAQYQIVYGRT